MHVRQHLQQEGNRILYGTSLFDPSCYIYLSNREKRGIISSTQAARYSDKALCYNIEIILSMEPDSSTLDTLSITSKLISDKCMPLSPSIKELQIQPIPALQLQCRLSHGDLALVKPLRIRINSPLEPEEW